METKKNDRKNDSAQTWQARLRALRSDAQSRLEASRSASRGVDTAFVTTDRDRTVGGNLLACAIAFRVFIWLLPFALVITAGLGFLHASTSGDPQHLAEELGLGRSVIAVVGDSAEQAERSRYVMLGIALIGLYTAGSAGAKTTTAVYRLAWGLPPSRRRGGPLASLAFTGALLVIIGLGLLAQVLRERIPGLGLSATIIVAVIWTLAWWGLSAALPHRSARITALFPGAALMGAGTQALHLVTVYYLSRKIDSASELYGGLGVAATLLLGLYFFSRLVVASALLNATVWERDPRAPHR